MPWTFYNANGQRLSSAATNISVLDIDGATDIGADIVDADLFIVDDGAGGTNRKTAASRLKTYAGTTQAVQSDIEAETNQDTYVPPDLLKKGPWAVKAQVFINAAGAISHAGTYGISGVDDDGTGDRGINFSTSFTTDDVYTGVETMYNSAGYIQASNWNKAYHDIITKVDDGTATDIISTGFFMGDT